MSKKDLITLIFLTSAAAVIIFYKFNLIPYFLAYDELDFAKLTLSLDGKPYSPYSTLATGHSTLYFYFILLSFKLFGISSLALRLPAALFGVATVSVFYLLMRRIFNKSYFIALLSVVTFFTLRWYFNFARFAFEATFLLFLETVSLYFIILYRDHHEKKYAIISGIFAGLAFNSYLPGRLFFFIPLLYLLAISWNKKKNINEIAKKILYFLAPFILVILPLSLYLFQHPDIRVDQQFYWKNDQLSLGEKISFLGNNFKSLLLVFNVQGDMNGRHNYPGKPTLNLISGIFFIAGLVISIRRIREPVNLLFISYFLLSILPTILTYPHENPNILRIFTAIPAVAYFITIPMLEVYKKTKKTKHKWIVLALIGIVLLSAAYELRTYFKFQSEVFMHSFEVRTDLQSALNGKLK